jgi:hypothetical protein
VIFKHCHQTRDDDFQSCTSRRSFEGLPGRHHGCRGLKAFRCDPGASFADSERKGGYFCFHVLASFSRAAHIARFLAKDADTARSLAGAAEEATQDTAVSKNRAIGPAARRVCKAYGCGDRLEARKDRWRRNAQSPNHIPRSTHPRKAGSPPFGCALALPFFIELFFPGLRRSSIRPLLGFSTHFVCQKQ